MSNPREDGTWVWCGTSHRGSIPLEDKSKELKAPDPGKTESQGAPSCFGILERVFPMGPEGLRVSPGRCLACEEKTLCLKTAMRSPAGLTFREERISEEEEAGMLGFWSRWSRKKHLHRMRQEALGKKPGPDKGTS